MPPALGPTPYYPSSSGMAPMWASPPQSSYPWPAMYQFPHNYIPPNPMPTGVSSHHSTGQGLTQHNPNTSLSEQPFSTPIPSVPHIATSGSSTNSPVASTLPSPPTEFSGLTNALVNRDNPHNSLFGPTGSNSPPLIPPVETASSLTDVHSPTANSGVLNEPNRRSPSISSDSEEGTQASRQGTMSSTPKAKRTRVSTRNPAFGHVQGVMLGASPTGIPCSMYHFRNSSDRCTFRHATHTETSTSAARLE